MQKNLFVRANTLYITLFLFAASVAQAATPRTLDPSASPWWQVAKRIYTGYRGVLDVIRLPIG